MDFTPQEQLEELEDLTGLVAAEIEAACYSVEGRCYSGALGLMHLAAHNEATRDLPLQLVEGTYGDDVHCWVEVDGQIFDPTQDQFTHAAKYTATKRHTPGPQLDQLRYDEATALYMWSVEGDWDTDGLAQLLGLDPDALEGPDQSQSL